jgi:integrase
MIRKTDYTLRESFETFYRSPQMKPRTVEAYHNALKHWETFTEDPPISAVDNAVLLQMKHRFLVAFAPSTFNKIRRHLLALFNKLAPPVKGNPGGLAIIPAFVYVDKARERETLPRVAGSDLVGAIYRACESAAWPYVDFGAPAWWRAAVVFLFNTGLRRNDFLNLKTADVDLGNHCLKFTAEKTGKARVVPLHQTVVDHFRAIWTDREYVFPKPTGNKSLYLHWHKIQTAAGLPRAEHITFHLLRATCGSNLFEKSPGAAQEMLGHSSVETTRRFYTNLSKQLKELAAAADQPAAFSSDPGTDPNPDILRFPA